MTIDLTTVTEVDPSGHLSTTASTSSFTGLLANNETAYQYLDYGAAYFIGSAYFEGEFNIASTTGSTERDLVIGFGDTLSALGSEVNACVLNIQFPGSNASAFAAIQLNESSVNTNTGSSIFINTGTTYYYRAGFLSSLSRYGTAFIQIFSDSGRTSLSASLTLARSAAGTYRYFYPCQSWGVYGNTSTITGTNANLTLFSPTVGVDLTTYTKVDAGSDITLYADVLLVSAMASNIISYVYNDDGAGHWTGNYTVEGVIDITGASGTGSSFYFSGLTNGLYPGDSTSTDQHHIKYTHTSSIHKFTICEMVSGGAEHLGTGITVSGVTYYWYTMWRDTTVGTHGTIYLAVYSDPTKQVQIGSTDSLALTSTSSIDFRYSVPLQSKSSGNSNTTSLTLGGVTYANTVTPIATIAYTEEDDTVAVAVTINNAATIAVTEDNDTVAAAGTVDTAASIAVTEGDDTVAATGTVESAASIAVTEEDDTVTVTGTSGAPSATILIDEEDDTTAATAEISNTGSVSYTEESDTSAVEGSFTVTQTDDFSVTVRNRTTGAKTIGLTGLVLLEAEDTATGYGFDFTDNQFRLISAIETHALLEFNSTHRPGLYSDTITTTNWDGDIKVTITCDDDPTNYPPQEWVNIYEYVSGVAVKVRSRAQPSDIPSGASYATDVRNELSTELARIDVPTSSVGVGDVPSVDEIAAARGAYIIEGTYTVDDLNRLKLSELISDGTLPSGDGDYVMNSTDGSGTRIEGNITNNVRTVTKARGAP